MKQFTSTKEEKVILQDRDQELLTFLFESKGASFKQIKTYIFQTKKHVYPYRRLKMLQRIGLIQSEVQKGHQTKKQFFLTKKACLAHFCAEDELHNYRIKSDKEIHDNMLIEVREKFKDLVTFDQYFTENMIKSSFYDPELAHVRDVLTNVSPDAFLIVNKANGSTHAAIELELSLKRHNRYKTIFSNYNLNPEIKNVFYLCGDKKIMKKLMRLEQNYLAEPKVSFFYIDLNDFLQEKEKIRFQNIKGQIIEFDLKVSTSQ